MVYYLMMTTIWQNMFVKKAKTGYPKAYRVTWAKGQADKVLKIAKLLEKYDLQKGMTIALQSMSQTVLDIIKQKMFLRANFKILYQNMKKKTSQAMLN